MLSGAGMASWWSELGRRNVLRVGAAYLALTWLLLQVSSQLTDTLELPAWLPKVVTVLLALGLPVALLLAWMFEWTPDGPIRDCGASTTGKRARRKSVAAPANGTDHDSSNWKRIHRIDLAIIGLLAAALAFSLWDRSNGGASDPVAHPRTDRVEGTDRNAADDEVRRVLVLPFRNLGSSETDGHFTDGLSEELMYALGALPDLAVLARGTSFALRDQTEELTALAARLDLDWVVEGTVRRNADTLRITARLIDAGTGVQRWTQAFNRSAADALRVQVEVAEAIAEELGLRSGSERPEIHASARAQALYLEARSLERVGSAESLAAASARLDATIEDSPQFLVAHLLAAIVEVRLRARDLTGFDQARQRIKALLDSMRRQAPDAPETEAVQAVLEWWLEPGDYRRTSALARLQGWRELQQRLPHITHLKVLQGWNLVALGRLDEGHRAFTEAVQIDPLNSMARANLSATLGALGRVDDANAIDRALLHEGSDYSPIRQALAESEKSRGRFNDAHRLLGECIEGGLASQCVFLLAELFAQLREDELARRTLHPSVKSGPEILAAQPLAEFLLSRHAVPLAEPLAEGILSDRLSWNRFSPYIAAELLARNDPGRVLALYGKAHPELLESPPPELTAQALRQAVPVARALILTGRAAQAMQLLTQALKARAGWSRTHFPFDGSGVAALTLAGRRDEAVDLLEELAELGWSDERFLRLSPSGRPSNLLPDFVADPRVVPILDRMRAHNQAELAAIRASGRALIPAWGSDLAVSASTGGNGDDDNGN